MKHLFFFLTISLLVLQSCDDDDLCLRGSGTVNDYVLELSEFEDVSLMGPVNLRIKQGTPQEVIVVAEPEIYGPMSYEVIGSLLEIGYKESVRCFDTDFGAWVNITVPDIGEIHVEGASIIESEGDIDLDRLEIDISGSAEIELSGQLGEQVIVTSGSVEANNFDLVSDTIRIDISGSADLEVYCTGLLDIKVNGSATIRYKGTPQIMQDVSGSLNLINAN